MSAADAALAYKNLLQAERGFTSKDGRFDQRSELDAEQKALLRGLNAAEPERVRAVSV